MFVIKKYVKGLAEITLTPWKPAIQMWVKLESMEGACQRLEWSLDFLYVANPVTLFSYSNQLLMIN